MTEADRTVFKLLYEVGSNGLFENGHRWTQDDLVYQGLYGAQWRITGWFLGCLEELSTEMCL